MSDILALRGYLHSARQPKPPPPAAPQKQTPAPAAVAAAAAAKPPVHRTHPGGFEKGDPRLGKPPWTKDRFPIAFMGGKRGTKKTAPRKREMYAALSAAVAMANPHMGGEALSHDFLTKHVRKIDVTRITNRMGLGELSVAEAAGHIARLSRGALMEPVVGGGGASSAASATLSSLGRDLAQGGPASSEIIAMNAPSTGPAPQPTVSSSADLLEPIHAAVGAGGVVMPDLPARQQRLQAPSAPRHPRSSKTREKPNLQDVASVAAAVASAVPTPTSVFNSPLPSPE